MKKALIVVDVQNDFCPGGALAVEGGDKIIPEINRIMKEGDYEVLIATQDWHPADHGSFASQHCVEPFTVGKLYNEDQVFWPDHCIQGSKGAEFHPDLDTDWTFDFIVQKGLDQTVDSYSGFFDNTRKNKTELDELLVDLGIDEVHVCGLATDYCVKFTALDSADLGYDTKIIKNASAGIFMNEGDVEEYQRQITEAGIEEIEL